MASNAPNVPTKCEYETVYKTPYVDPRFSTLVQHQGIWFSLAIMPQLQRFEQVRQFAIEDDDIAVISFPKSGIVFAHCAVFTARRSCASAVLEVVILSVCLSDRQTDRHTDEQNYYFQDRASIDASRIKIFVRQQVLVECNFIHVFISISEEIIVAVNVRLSSL